MFRVVVFIVLVLLIMSGVKNPDSLLWMGQYRDVILAFTTAWVVMPVVVTR